MKTLTVFTPTFNRAFCLGQLYESLCRQTSPDFLWLIIDDGSTDNTRNLVVGWQAEGKIEIRYHYQPNCGMHSGHNQAYALIDTQLNTCIDSDDYMPDDAVENILKTWQERGSKNVAGIIGLDAYKDGRIVGTGIPSEVTQSKLSELYQQRGVSGDKKLVIRTDVVRQYPPYPVFEGEKFVPLGTLYLMIDQDYDWLCVNDVYCIVEYLPDGSSHNIFKQYRKSPRGFGYSRLIEMQYSKSTIYSYTRAMHLVSSALFSGNYNIFKSNPRKFLTLLAVPMGVLLHGYILFKSR